MSESSESAATNETVPTSEPPAGSEPPHAPVKPRRRRRWPWVLGADGRRCRPVPVLHRLGHAAGLHRVHRVLLDVPRDGSGAQAYMNSPHSRVECGTCHIGPGVIPAIQAKLAAVRYLWVYPTNSYERPIPSPIHSLRPTTIVCEQCHWPQKFYEDRLAIIPDYAPDEQNSLTQTQLLMKTGGGSAQVRPGPRHPLAHREPGLLHRDRREASGYPLGERRVRRQSHRVPLHRQHADAGGHRQCREAEDGLRGLP